VINKIRSVSLFLIDQRDQRHPLDLLAVVILIILLVLLPLIPAQFGQGYEQIKVSGFLIGLFALGVIWIIASFRNTSKIIKITTASRSRG
jgi:hypothetical protein